MPRPASVATGRQPSELVRIEDFLTKNLFSWARPDYRSESGGKITALGDKVTLIGNVVANARSVDANHAYSQANASFQYAAPSASAFWGGNLVALSTNATWYQSTLSTALWNFTAQAGPVTIVSAHRPTQEASAAVLFSDAVGAAGAVDSVKQAGSGMLTRISSLSLTSGPPGWAVNVPHVLRITYGTSLSPQVSQYRGNTLMTSGSYTVGANNDVPMQIGRSSASFVGEQVDFMVAKSASATLIAAIERYMLLRYGYVT